MAKSNMKYVSITVRSRRDATSGSSDGEHWLYTLECAVEPDGTVRVYDPCARAYTLCHSMTADQQDAARRAAGLQ